MRYERALEVLVVVLLGAAGLCVAVAVYEANRHHSAALWWALAAGTFIASVLIPAVWFGVHPLFVWGRGWSAKWRDQAAAQAVARRQRAPAPRAVVEAADVDPAVIEVVYTSYGGPSGFDDQLVDVLQRLRSNGGSRLSFQVTNQVLGEGRTDYDPAPGEVKVLQITYLYGGTQHTVSINEGDEVNLP